MQKGFFRGLFDCFLPLQSSIKARDLSQVLRDSALLWRGEGLAGLTQFISIPPHPALSVAFDVRDLPE